MAQGRAATQLVRHHLRAWMVDRGVKPMELLALLNDQDTEEDGIIDKSQVYRWLKGQLPHEPTQLRIATALELVNPRTGKVDAGLLQQHPTQVWLSTKMDGRSADELRRMKTLLDTAFPD